MLDLDAIKRRAALMRDSQTEELADDILALLAELTAARKVVEAARKSEFNYLVFEALSSYYTATGGKP